MKDSNILCPEISALAAFPLAAALVTQSELTLKNIDMNDSQGDKELIRVFQKMGAKIKSMRKIKHCALKRGDLFQGSLWI